MDLTRSKMVKIHVVVLLLCTQTTIQSMDWLKSFGTPTSSEAPVAAARAGKSQDKQGNTNQQHNSNLFEQFRQQSEQLIAQSKAKGQELIQKISPQKKQPEPNMTKQSTVSKLEPSKEEVCRVQADKHTKPIAQKLAHEYAPKLEPSESCSSFNYIKVIGLGVISIGMTAILYTFIQKYGKTPVYRKRPWH